MKWLFVCLLAVSAIGLGACGSDDLVAPSEQLVPIESVLDGAIVITVDPNGITPLAAKAEFHTKVPVNVSIEVLGAEPMIHKFPGVAFEHDVAIFGLYPGTRNRIEVRIADVGKFEAVDTVEISTDTLPEFFPSVEIVAASAGEMERGWILSSLSFGDNGVFRTQRLAMSARAERRASVSFGLFMSIPSC